MKVTAKDIAKHLGVSAATVSMVFRNKPGISEAVRKQVIDAANELGFEYNNGMSTNKKDVIQLVMYKRHGKVVSDTPFFEHLTKGVIDSVNELGYQLSISYFYRTESINEQIKSIKSTNCVGIVLIATEMHSSDLSAFESLDVPIVLLDNWFFGKNFDCVVIDNQRGAWNAVQHLIKNGHKRLGYLHSNINIRNFNERKDGYLSSVNSAKEFCEENSKSIVLVGTTIETAYSDMLEYLSSEPILPTAFFADNDIIAAGCVRALLKCGYHVPKEVSIISFDDMPLCELVEPNLSTMAVPKQRMGALAIERLDKQIKNKTGSEIIKISVFPEIVERSSVQNLLE